VRAVGDRRAAAPPVPRQGEADILPDHVDHRRLQLFGVDVLGIDPTQRLRRGDLGGMTGGLAGTEIAAIAEHSEQVAPNGLGELRIRAGGRPEVPGIAGPVFGIFEDVEEVALRHPGADFLLKSCQSLGLTRPRQLLQVERSIRVDAQLGVGRKRGIDFGGGCRQFLLQRDGEVLAAFGYAERRTIGGQSRLAFGPGKELGPIVGEVLRAHHIEIAGLQGLGQMSKDADFECAPIENDKFRPALGHKILPALRGKTNIDLVQHFMTARVAEPVHDGQGMQQAGVLRRRADIQQVEQSEQQASVPGVDRPEQWQVVVAMPAGHGLPLLGQGLDAAALREELSDLMPELGIGFLFLRGLEHLAEDADQGFLDLPVPSVEVLQLLLGCGLRSPDAAQHHLDQFVATAHAGLPQQAEQQRVPPARLRDIEEIAHFQNRGLGSELAQLGMGDALQERVRIDQAGQPVEPLDPKPDRFRGRGPGVLFEAVEAGRQAVRRPGQQGVQHRLVIIRQTRRHSIVDPRMDLGAQPVYQPIEGAERGQVDGGRLQRLDRPINEIGRITHGFGGLESDLGDQTLGRRAVRSDRKVSANRRLIAIQRFCPARLLGLRQRSEQSKLQGQMRNGIGVDLVRRGKASEVLPRLQQRRQQQLARITAGVRVDEGKIRIGQPVSGIQFLAGQPSSRTRICGAVDGRHGMSGKGAAGAAEGRVWGEEDKG